MDKTNGRIAFPFIPYEATAFVISTILILKGIAFASSKCDVQIYRIFVIIIKPSHLFDEEILMMSNYYRFIAF